MWSHGDEKRATYTQAMYFDLTSPKTGGPAPQRAGHPRSPHMKYVRPRGDGAGMPPPQPKSARSRPEPQSGAFGGGGPRKRARDGGSGYDLQPQPRSGPSKRPRPSGASGQRNPRPRPRQPAETRARLEHVPEQGHLAPPPGPRPPLHVVFVVDTSGSMSTADARVGGALAQRIDAVVECVSQFVAQTAADMDANVAEVYSVLSFGQEASVACAAVSRSAMTRGMRREGAIRRSLKCGGGTNFSAAFAELGPLVGGAEAARTHVIFLSDGRPGDLRWPPPAHSREASATYKSHGRTRASCITTGRQLAADHGKALTFDYISVGPEESSQDWLLVLSQVTGGKCVHHADMTVPPAAGPVVLPPPPVGPMMPPPPGAMMPPRPRGSATAGTSSLGSSLADTFGTISSSLTASVNRAARQLRPVRFEAPEAHQEIGEDVAERTFQPSDVKQMCLHRSKEGAPYTFVPVPGDAPTFTIRDNPFAKGGQRLAFTAFLGASKCVAKESKFYEQYADRLSFHIEPCRAHLVADEYSSRFNAALRRGWRRPRVEYPECRLDSSELAISFLPSDVYRLRDAEAKGGFRYVTVEKHLTGDYFKYNGNNGYLGARAMPGSLSAYHQAVADAFTHYTWHESKHTIMVCDVQGVGLTFTDPSVLSAPEAGADKFGKTDIGMTGIGAFMRKHTCSPMCRLLGLPPAISAGGADGGGAASVSASVSIATSQITVEKTRHLQQRKNQRAIETRDCQAAVKHGAHEAGRNGRILHRHKGITYVTDATHKVGVTAYRSDGQAPAPARPAVPGFGDGRAAARPAVPGWGFGDGRAAARPAVPGWGFGDGRAAAALPPPARPADPWSPPPTSPRAGDGRAAAAAANSPARAAALRMAALRSPGRPSGSNLTVGWCCYCDGGRKWEGFAGTGGCRGCDARCDALLDWELEQSGIVDTLPEWDAASQSLKTGIAQALAQGAADAAAAVQHSAAPTHEWRERMPFGNGGPQRRMEPFVSSYRRAPTKPTYDPAGLPLVVTGPMKAGVLAAVQAQLTELLEVECEEVLCEYVMVMIGNRKPLGEIASALVELIGDKDHMDLGMRFGIWLWENLSEPDDRQAAAAPRRAAVGLPLSY